jgi:hypothetical protein
MPKNKPWAIALTAALLSALSACGSTDGVSASDPAPAHSKNSAAPSGDQAEGQGAGGLAIPADADPETRKAYLQENLIAACMKKKGFVYTPNVIGDEPAFTAIDGADYALAKEYRQKYGYGMYSGLVYPDDPKVPGSKASQQDQTPNLDYTQKLTPAQQAAWELALRGPTADIAAAKKAGKNLRSGGCSGEADDKVYGKPKSAAEQREASAAEAEKNRASGQALNGDPQLVQLAQSYASCLSEQGIPVTTTQPTSIADAVKFSQSSKLPVGEPLKVDRSQALSLLTKDIDIAMKDLECGKEFRAAYFPKLKANPYSGGGKG